MAPRVILRLLLLWTSSHCTDVGTVPVVRPYPVNLPVPLKGSISDFRSYRLVPGEWPFRYIPCEERTANMDHCVGVQYARSFFAMGAWLEHDVLCVTLYS
ncbi:hypothetical protein EDB19DRAFT_534890 [Suillus lakei]|nr:hypothetical protein EDB19DRAFT_534890 [Suillus lakei]